MLPAAPGAGSAVQVFGTDYGPPDGTAVRDHVHVSDLVHLRAVDYVLNEGESIAVNLGTGEGVSVRQIIETVQKITCRDVSVREAQRRPGDPPVLVACPNLAHDVLDWLPERSDLPTIITDAWRWHCKLLRNRRS